jgi:molybdate transport system substrate-binding protein
MKALVAAALCVLTLAACGSAPQSREVRVAAAADLTFAMADIIELVQDVDPSITVLPTYGSSGQFLQQIVNGAPFDLYLSADVAFPDELVVLDLADAADRFDYAVGRLVVWTTKPELGVPTLQTLTDPRVKKIAIANPRHAPYGRAAESAIDQAGLTTDVQGKLVLGENVSQAAEFVLSGSADVGIVALSLVLADPVRDTGTWSEIPFADYPTIRQGGVVLQRARDIDAARTVRDVLTSPAGRDVLSRYGFRLADE